MLRSLRQRVLSKPIEEAQAAMVATEGPVTPDVSLQIPGAASTVTTPGGGYYFGSQTPRREQSAGDYFGGGFAYSMDISPSENSREPREPMTGQRLAFGIVAERLYREAATERLFSDNINIWNGVALRLTKGQFVACPDNEPRTFNWIAGLCDLNCEASLTVTATAVAGITTMLAPGTTEVALTPVDRVQVLETMEELGSARKAQGAAFIRCEDRLVIWTDRVDQLIPAAMLFEKKLINYIWQRATGTDLSGLPMNVASGSSSDLRLVQQQAGVRQGRGGEKLITVNASERLGRSRSRVNLPTLEKEGGAADSESISEKEKGDVEYVDPEELVTYQERAVNLQAPLMHGIAVALNTVLVCLMLRTLVWEAMLDSNWARLAIFCVSPGLFVISLFFSDTIINGIFLIVGPIRQMSMNTRYFSGKAPERIVTGKLPHITIQMPVYKEPLDSVLAPTIESVNKAIATYELQGGTASIIVSEDGLMLVDDEERQKRLDFYDRNQVAWVARPGHNVEGYKRAGRFKKASNLNFTCGVSMATEKFMEENRPEDLSNWSSRDEDDLYGQALQQSLFEAHPLAQAAGNIRMGDLILLIDCDTQVPLDCFLDAASEMAQCPDVAILQHCSGVMLVTENNYFEKGIGFFTRCVNFAISYTVANGDVAPFMGHNAFLRWSAVQEASFIDEEDGQRKVWSESTVSEDFDMALRVLMKGYIVRWATYSNEEFKEGVSLTCDDELNRWQKYAFGVSELIFNPLHLWFRRGPVTKLWRSFLWTGAVPVHAKFGSLSYVFSYYAIASALPLSVALLFLEGLAGPTNDLAFLSSFKMWVAVTVVFSVGGNVSGIIARYRARSMTFGRALVEYVTWIPFMTVFFSGLSYHVLTALFSHAFSINMTWGSTNKSLGDSNFFLELPSIARNYWKQIILCFLIIVVVVIFLVGGPIPIEWQLHGGFYVVFPTFMVTSGHILYHITLNPSLLRFSF
ncbi:unnamed protein product [Jaminaea pallidilutea]